MRRLRSGNETWVAGVVALVILLALPAAAVAQPFGLWTEFVGDGTAGASDGFLSIPDAPALNPVTAITIEAWIQMDLPFANQTCRSIIGKDYTKAWWVGVCSGQLRSYTHGFTTTSSSSYTSGTILPGSWVHVAVTSDGFTRHHYIDGELVGTVSETGPITGSPSPVEIGGDVSWAYSPHGNVDEVRLWNVARSQAEIQATINVPLTSPQAGLVAVWPMGGPNDPVGGHNGTFHGNVPPILGPPAEATCGSSSGQFLCLQGHYLINAGFRTGAPGTALTPATIVEVANTGSGIFWFFTPDDWEIMAKVINGCALNNQWWVFSAATTNVFYELDVTNVLDGSTKRYFNYPGPPAPAVTDTSAFSCP